jgi:hypothetical protein
LQEFFLSHYYEKKMGRVVQHTEPLEVEVKRETSYNTVDIVAVLVRIQWIL